LQINSARGRNPTAERDSPFVAGSVTHAGDARSPAAHRCCGHDDRRRAVPDRFAVTAQVAGIDIQTVGLILMIVGIVGLALGLLLTARRSSGRPPDGL
jgi:hypothetical protein